MTVYAMVDGAGAVVWVEQCDQTPAAGALTPILLSGASAALPSKTYAKATLMVANGALYWRDDRTLADAQAERWGAIKEARADRLTATFTADSKVYNCNRQAISTAAIGAMLAKARLDLEWSKTWTLADNTSTTLTADQMLAVAKACDDYITAIWSTARTLRAQIYSASTVSAVDAINWP
jgi:hypothetical protein